MISFSNCSSFFLLNEYFSSLYDSKNDDIMLSVTSILFKRVNLILFKNFSLSTLKVTNLVFPFWQNDTVGFVKSPNDSLVVVTRNCS